jgi:hypothetical protein
VLKEARAEPAARRLGVIAMRNRIVAALLFLLLSPSIAAADFDPAGIARAGLSIDAELGRISVVPAGWQLEIYPLPSTLQPLLPRWGSALRNALQQAAIFRGGSAPPLSLSVPPLSLSVKVMEFALTGNTLTVFARYQLDSPASAAPLFQTDVMTDAGVTSIDSGLPILDYSARATENRQQVDQAVRLNIAEFIDRLVAFVAAQPYRAARAG